jgi:Niemann-Pick C1 protein
MWEKAFNARLKELKEQQAGSEKDYQFYYSSARSYADVNAEMWTKTVRRLVLGFALMFVFLQIVLSKFSWLEIRLLVGLAGLCSCGMAIMSGFAIAAATGYKMTTTQLSIPFLIIGLGVDDMFVIMSSLRKTHTTHSGMELAKKIALAMQSAGTSITITSLTDIVVFLVGMITVIPSLKSYCFYAAPCILMTYIFVITFFVAVLTLDERRIAARRNFLVPCVKHKTPDKLMKQQNLIEAVMLWSYTNLVLTRPGKVRG